ncbi:hypothetical protein KW796_02785 [Candidatus Parcubacteria bacterium]|nr:hypothetical protein [Candidatus Parcubacteria bacterium]
MAEFSGHPTKKNSRGNVTPESFENLKNEVKKVNYLMVGIIIVLFVGFFGGAVALGGIIVDGYRSREASYGILANKIDMLINISNQGESNSLQNQIDDLKSRNPYLK